MSPVPHLFAGSRMTVLAAAAACLLAAVPARAAAPYAMGDSPADREMAQGMATMQRSMQAAPMNGNPDHDFASMMIPHHQGAIDMAQVELQDGKDPDMRRLARTVIAAQRREIAHMRSWLAAHPNS